MSLTPEQLAVRRTGITGTDLPAILGLVPWRSPLDVWLDKLGKAPPVEVTEDMERGIYLEDGARHWYEHRTGATVSQPGTVVCRRNPLVIATPDGLARLPSGEVRALELKMPSRALGWGDAGTDAVPDYYLPQVAWELAALDVQTADVFAVLEGKPRLYHVTRDAELEGMLVEEAERFWRDFVQPQRPPPAEGRDLPSVTRWLRRHETDDYLDFASLPPEVQVVLEEYLRAYQDESTAADRLATWEARAKLALMGAPGVRGLPEESGFHRLDWRTTKGRTETDWKAVKSALADEDPAFARRMQALIEQHTTTREGSRPFIPRVLTKEKRR